MMAKKKYPYCHPWHGDNPTFIFWMTRDEYRNRVRKIKECKPPHEVPIRLAIFKEVDISLLPKWLIKTRAAYDKADAAYDKADAAFDKARAAYDKADAAYDKASAAYDKADAACDKADAAYDKARAACDKADAAYDKAGAAYDKAGAACDIADAAFDKARAAYVEACGKHRSELEKLHKKICGCKYWNGREVVFPQAGEVEHE